jgi:hypothetical protein
MQAAGNGAGFAITMIPLLFILTYVIACVYSMFWGAMDARSRGKSGILVALLILLLHPWPLGLVLWLLLRPEPITQT